MNQTKREWLDKMTDLHGLDEEDIIEITELFFDSYYDSVNEMENAFNTDEINEFVRLIHGIKGAAANIGFDEISKLAGVLEEQGKHNRIEDYPSQLSRITECVETRKNQLFG